MSALTLPVPWTSGDDKGLKGVIDIHRNELPRQKFEGSRVCELLTALSEKLNDRAQRTKKSILAVESIQLHGNYVSDDCLLESLIPDLESSAPRLVATVRTRRQVQEGGQLLLYIKTFTGKNITVACMTDDALGYVKTRIRDKAHIPVDDVRILYGSKQLDDSRKVSHYRIRNGSMLHLVPRLRGGISDNPPGSRSFVDVTNGSGFVKLNFSDESPRWRECTMGLNIEGYCRNDECRAFGQWVIDPLGFRYFNLINERDVECPECYSKVKPITCGFYNCAWKYDGIKTSDMLSICSRWKEATGYKYYRFSASCGVVDWSSLLLVAKPLGEASAAELINTPSTDVSMITVCTMCWSRFGPLRGESTRTYGCGHTFHSTCADVWSEWCESNNTQPRCPSCFMTALT